MVVYMTFLQEQTEKLQAAPFLSPVAKFDIQTRMMQFGSKVLKLAANDFDEAKAFVMNEGAELEKTVRAHQTKTLADAISEIRF